MKKLKYLTLIFIVGLVYTSCTDSTDDNSDLIERHLKLAEESEGGTIEYVTLEELNALYASKGMKEVTLEELGATEEEYLAGQKKYNNPDRIHTRWCTGSTAVTFLDIDNNTVFNAIDVYYAQQAILGHRPIGQEETLFGMATVFWNPYNWPQFSTLDIVVANKILLGIYPCM